MQNAVIAEKNVRKRHKGLSLCFPLMIIISLTFLFTAPVYADNFIDVKNNLDTSSVRLDNNSEVSSELSTDSELKGFQSSSVFLDTGSVSEGSITSTASTPEQDGDDSNPDQNSDVSEGKDNDSNTAAGGAGDVSDSAVIVDLGEKKPEKKETSTDLIFANAVFNSEYYLSNNQDVLNAYGDDGAKAYRHFLSCGVYEGRRGSGSFDVVSYYNEYPDLRAAFGTDIWRYYDHYLRYGQREGRHASGCSGLVGAPTASGGTDYSAVYDPSYYLDRYPDLKAAFSRSYGQVALTDYRALLSHFVRCGMAEGRVTSPAFDLPSYYNANEDLRAAYGMDLRSYYRHYIRYGKAEGRTCTGVGSLTSWRHSGGGTDYSPVYDGAYYFDCNPDLQAAFSRRLDGGTIVDDGALLSHFLRCGVGEGRRGNESFDVVSYYNANEDLRAAFGLNFGKFVLHYAQYGYREGRSCAGVDSLTSFLHAYKGVELRAVYDGAYYYANNPDLQLAFLKLFNGISFYDDGALVAHFVLNGVYEGRRGNGSSFYNAHTAKVLAVAAKEVGYHDLSDPQRGSKYGRWYAVKTGRAVFGYDDIAWCAMYASWVLNQAGVNCAGMPGSGCVTIYRNAKGSIVPISEARAGDLILFDWNPWLGDGADHIGIVLENDGTSFKTIEGNTSRSDAGSQDDGGWVAARTRPLSKVYAIIRPYY